MDDRDRRSGWYKGESSNTRNRGVTDSVAFKRVPGQLRSSISIQRGHSNAQMDVRPHRRNASRVVSDAIVIVPSHSPAGSFQTPQPSKLLITVDTPLMSSVPADEPDQQQVTLTHHQATLVEGPTVDQPMGQ